MATFTQYNIGETSFTGEFSGLQYPAKDYDQFDIDVYKNSSFVKTHSWTSTNTYNDTRGTVTGLSSSTTYEFKGWAKYNGSWVNVGNVTATTLSPPDTTNPTVNITSPSNYSWTNSSSITIYASASDNAGVSYVNFYNATLGTITDYSSSYSATFNISSLSEGQHTFSAKAYDSAGNSSTTDYLYLNIDRTAPSATISGTSATVNSITLNVNATDGGSGVSGFDFYLNDVYKSTVYNSSSASYTFTGLTADTTYKVGVKSFDNALNYSSQKSQNVSTKTSRPTNWKWTTAQDVNGHKNSGVNFRMGNQEWNDFCVRINEFLLYKGFPQVTFTSASYGSNFTASMFNEAKNAIGGMVATGIANKVSGDNVNASDFNTLMDKLNSL